jgi:hypothetical protein
MLHKRHRRESSISRLHSPSSGSGSQSTVGRASRSKSAFSSSRWSASTGAMRRTATSRMGATATRALTPSPSQTACLVPGPAWPLASADSADTSPPAGIRNPRSSSGATKRRPRPAKPSRRKNSCARRSGFKTRMAIRLARHVADETRQSRRPRSGQAHARPTLRTSLLPK